MQDLKNLAVFVTVSELQSFSKAAEKLFLTRSAVSKIISKLEEDLQVTLFHRKTKEISLTNEGTIFYEHSLRAINEISDAKEIINSKNKQVNGVVKLTVPVMLGKYHLIPLLKKLLKDQPNLILNISCNDKFIDLNQSDIDIAIRISNELQNNNFSYQKIGNHNLIVCATKKYLEINGVPSSLEDLSNHQSIIYSRDGIIQNWKFIDNYSNIIEINPKSRFITDNCEAVFDSVLNDDGLGWLPTWLVKPYIDAGILIEVLNQYKSIDSPINIIWKKSNFLPSRTKAVLDYLTSEEII